MICFNHNLIWVHCFANPVWTQRYDLHSHSTNSDGEHSVDYVANLMKKNEVKHWSLTDHDTISGWPMAETAAKDWGLLSSLV